MVIDDVLRRLRGAIGNALVWGAAWFVTALVVFSTLRVVGIISVPWPEVAEFAARAGVIGGVVGGAFSSIISLLYHGRRIPDINWVRFGIGGGLFAGLFAPLFFQFMNLLSGDGLVAWELVLDDALLTALFGGVAAGGSLKLAQQADARLPSRVQDQVDSPEEPKRLDPSPEGADAGQENLV